MPVLALEHVTKSFGGVRALRDATFTVAEGEMLAVLGPSGSGKTTLLRAIAGLERIDRGRITIGERDVTTAEAQHRDIALVFQDFALFPHLSVRANIAFGAGRGAAGRVAEIARRFRIDALLDRAPATLSGGEKQRVAVARAVAARPAALLFDEPFASLDAPLRSALRAELADLRDAAPLPSIFVTHDQQEALALGDRVAVMDGGEIVALDTPRVLLAAPPNPFVASFLGSPPANVFAGRLIGGRFVADADAAITTSSESLAPDVRTIAVRPERVRVAAAGTLRGRVRLIETFGERRYATIATERTTIVAVAQDTLATGDSVALDVDYTGMWTYDANGRRG
ncbi:MAG: ABC transporter ATP-binding protein [Candidatus Velthaea sp.]